MAILNRVSTVIQSKFNRILDGLEDPRESLEYSYQKQMDLLRDVKRGVANVIASKKKLETQKAALMDQSSQLEMQIKKALAVERDDLAAKVIEKKLALQEQLNRLTREIGDLEKEQEQLMTAENGISTNIDRFRTTKEVVKAQYSAAEAQVKISEAASGLDNEISDVGAALRRAREKTENMRSRAAAMEEMHSLGLLHDTLAEGDAVERELNKISTAQHVAAELERLKKEVSNNK